MFCVVSTKGGRNAVNNKSALGLAPAVTNSWVASFQADECLGGCVRVVPVFRCSSPCGRADHITHRPSPIMNVAPRKRRASKAGCEVFRSVPQPEQTTL